MRIILIMKHANKCSAELLAAGKECRIELCCCGIVHLHIKELSIRLDKESFYDLYRTLNLSVQNIMATK